MSDESQPRIGLEEAGRRAGLHYMTIYRHVRTGRLPAEQRGGRWLIDPKDLPLLEVRAAPGRGRRPRFEETASRLGDRLLSGDGAGAWTVIEEALARGVEPGEVYVRLLGPAMAEIGRRWSAGTVSVEAEHRATAVAIRLVGRFSARFSPRGSARNETVILGGSPGDPHLLPVTMAADLLRLHHLRVVDLGANVPTAAFLEAAAAATCLAAVGVSLSDESQAGAASHVLASVKEAHPDVLLLAGGPALATRESALAIGANEWAADGLALAALIT